MSRAVKATLFAWPSLRLLEGKICFCLLCFCLYISSSMCEEPFVAVNKIFASKDRSFSEGTPWYCRPTVSQPRVPPGVITLQVPSGIGGVILLPYCLADAAVLTTWSLHALSWFVQTRGRKSQHPMRGSNRDVPLLNCSHLRRAEWWRSSNSWP